MTEALLDTQGFLEVEMEWLSMSITLYHQFKLFQNPLITLPQFKINTLGGKMKKPASTLTGSFTVEID